MLDTAVRHFCRNPRCRQKLAQPVKSPRKAFCSRGCHASFYRSRCLVCERELERDRPTGSSASGRLARLNFGAFRTSTRSKGRQSPQVRKTLSDPSEAQQNQALKRAVETIEDRLSTSRACRSTGTPPPAGRAPTIRRAYGELGSVEA